MSPFISSSFLPFFAGTLMLAIFLIDALTPLNIAIAVLYGAVILLASFTWPRSAIIGLTFFCLVLTLIAYAIGHQVDFFGPAFGRCMVSLSAIAITAFLALKGQDAAHALRQREESLRQADRRKDEFIAMLAHELRNPLAAINAAAHLLKISDPQPNQLQEISGVILRQSNHLGGLVDDLLDVSRVSRGVTSLKKENIDMNRVVSDAVEQVRPLIETKRHHFVLDVPSEPVFVYGDYQRLVQVVANLLNNAAKYTPDGGDLSLQLYLQGEQAVLEVADTGIGISAELLPHVFGLFTQAERGVDHTQGGLGIGLALVKALVELHGGSVYARSRGSSMGSRFIIELKTSTPPKSSTPVKQTLPEQTKQERLRIMVVDDNEDVGKMLASLLVAAGHNVTVLRSAKEVLASADQNLFDVYILDIGLPDLDGHQLARQLRASHKSERALMIAMTGYGQEEERRKALASGFNHFLLKPVDPPMLLGLLDKTKSGT